MPRISWNDNRLWIVVGVLFFGSLLCSLVNGLAASLRCLLFFAAAALPLGLGSLLIYHNFWWRPPLWGLLLEALLFGLVGLEIALLGIVLNPQAQTITWGQKLSEAAPVGVLAFLAVMLIGPLVLRIARIFRH